MLFDYSNRQWSALIRGFYRPRWARFLDHLAAQPTGPGRFDDRDVYTSHGRPGDEVSPFYRELSRWERAWTEGTETYPARAEGDPWRSRAACSASGARAPTRPSAAQSDHPSLCVVTPEKSAAAFRA